MTNSSEATPLLNGNRRSDGTDEPTNGAVPSDKKPSRTRELLLFAWAIVATAAIVVGAVWVQHASQIGGGRRSPPPSDREMLSGKRNLIFMVSDGMGPASLSLTRSFRQHVENLPKDDVLTLDRHFWGTSRTRSSSSLVTDSAAGATAFSCGLKTYNGAISVLPGTYDPCGTVLEAAHRAGYRTGLVVTTDITDATPACFASHVVMRVLEDDIALQEVGEGVLGRVVDLMLGGGRCHFLPNSTEGSCRLDDVDVVDIARKKHGWNYADDRKGFEKMKGGDNVDLPMLGLFAGHDIPFELDRRNMADVYPSLSEMTETALRALEKATEDSDQGFFLMVEASRIDHAGHINDPAAQVREVLEYDKAFQAVLDFLDQSGTEGILVATSDHETGGLATALQEPGHLPVYNWYPQVLANSNASAQHVARRLHQHVTENDVSDKTSLKDWITTELLIQGLGITDTLKSEMEAIVDNSEDATYVFSEMVSVRAHIGWSTHGHSAVDVNIYSSGGPGTSKLRGNVENTDIGKFLRDWLDVDVDSVTEELREKMGGSQRKALDLVGNMPDIEAEQVPGDANYDIWMQRAGTGVN